MSRARTGWALLAAMALATAVLVPLGLAQRGPAGRPRSPGLRGPRPPAQFLGRPAPAFDLRDARGGRLSARALRGRPFAVTFLYTRCVDTCPLIGAQLAEALSRLGPLAARVSVVAVSVDPAHDTAAAARAWLRRLREPPSFHYLVGTARELAPVWDAYSVEPQDPRYVSSTHSASIWLVDRAGRLRVLYESLDPVRPGDVAADLRTLAGPG
jgi:protein SCO1/2